MDNKPTGVREGETFADAVRAVIGPHAGSRVAAWGGISHTYISQWQNGKVPSRRLLLDAVRQWEASPLRLSADLRARLFRAAGYIDPEAPADLDQVRFGRENPRQRLWNAYADIGYECEQRGIEPPPPPRHHGGSESLTDEQVDAEIARLREEYLGETQD
jgi:transcriptional regulator with XRE-family HTH domain